VLTRFGQPIVRGVRVSPQARESSLKPGVADVMMAPASDMFEMGVNLQVLKRGTMFRPRGRKLYEWYAGNRT